MKRIIALLLIVSVLIIPAAAVSGEPDISAPSVLLMEKETGTILYEYNSHERLAPASVTKVMTLLLIVEAIDNGTLSLSDMVTTSTRASSMGGSQVFLKEGETMSVDDMLKSVVISSANDAAVALAEHIAGSESAFVERMNQRAAQLGMNDTTFVNCTGLDAEGHLTSAHDIAVMSRALIAYPLIREYTTTWMDSIRDGEFQLSNTNKLIRFYDGATGLKTGSTSTALYCLSATAERDGMELIAAVMKAPTSVDRFETAKSLLSFGFANYTLVSPVPEGPLPEAEISLGEHDTLSVELSDNSPVLLEKEQAANISTSVTLIEQVEAPVSKGQKLGELTISSGGKTIKTIDLVASSDCERLNVWDIFKNLLSKLGN